MKSQSENQTDFRDRLSIVSEEGKRVWIYPRRPSGKYYRYRIILSLFLFAFFFIAPHITIQNTPIFLFNVVERKFILFAQIFWPQDSYIFFVIMLLFIIFIILFTVSFGRLWCGWACPQSVFMEMVFRNIEYLIEGDASKQRRLNNQPWNLEKIWKKLVKHSLFYLISFAIGFTILSFIRGGEFMIQSFKSGLQTNSSLIIGTFIFSTVIYFIFAKVRELVCTIICPYGRLQSVLLDTHSVVVAYDYKRGEPRAKLNPLENRNDLKYGDCIDCTSCVLVCPAGIDIRNGTQLECTNCTACIDACNKIMERTRKPKGLIRYASERNIREGEKFKITPRIIGYTTVLVLLFSFLVFLLVSRADIETTILRTPGILPQKEGTNISNLYNIKIINKTHADIPLTVKLLNSEGKIKLVGNETITVKKESTFETVFFITINQAEINQSANTLKIGIFSNNEMLEEKEVNFLQ